MYIQFESEYTYGCHADLARKIAATLADLLGVDPDSDTDIAGECDEPLAEALIVLFDLLVELDRRPIRRTEVELLALMRAVIDRSDGSAGV